MQTTIVLISHLFCCLEPVHAGHDQLVALFRVVHEGLPFCCDVLCDGAYHFTVIMLVLNHTLSLLRHCHCILVSFLKKERGNISKTKVRGYRNFACIRRTFLHKFLPIIRGCVLYTELENQGVLHRVPRPHGDWKSMTRHYRTPYQNKPLVCFHFSCVSNMFSTSQLQWYR